MRRAARTRDDGFDAARPCGFGVFKHQIRGTVCGNDARLIFYAELFKKLRCLPHNGPIAVAAHDDADLYHKSFLVRMG